MDKYETAKWANHDVNKNDSMHQDIHQHPKEDEVEMRAVIQYLMMDEEFFRMNKKDWKEALKHLVKGMEALAWLHNCKMLQSQMGHMSRELFCDLGFWMITRSKYLFYTKNRNQSCKSFIPRTNDLIMESNKLTQKALSCGDLYHED